MRALSRGWLAAIAAALVLVIVPYLVAWRAQPQGFVFSGFLDNPVDGFSYLAKMRQGAGGAWLFHLPYTTEPSSGAFLFVYYLLLGHMQRWLAAPPEIVYHTARLLGAAGMFGAAFAFFRTTLPTPGARRWALALTLIGSGLGWIGIALGRLAIDLWVPEAIPFLSAYANPHFPLAAAAMLVGLTSIASPDLRRGPRLAWAVAAGLVLGLAQPFAVIPVILVGMTWLFWMQVRPTSEPRIRRDQWMAEVALFLASAPWLVYDAWVTWSHADLAAWASQNLTPTPPWVDVFLGFGAALILAIVALYVLRPQATAGGRLLAAWFVVGLLLVFLPFNLQRRLLLGLYFPMAGLAGWFLAELAARGRRGARWAAYAIFALCLPSNFVVVAATLGAALRQAPEIVLTSDERNAYAWVNDSLPAGAVVLAGEVSGNRLPAYANVRVVYGHPFETPHAAEARAWVDSVLRSTRPVEDVVKDLRSHSVDFVFVGPRERSLGSLPWLARLERVFVDGDVSIFQVPTP